MRTTLPIGYSQLETNKWSFLSRFYKTIDALIRSHKASKTSADVSLGNDFDANDWIIKVDESQVLNELAVPHPTLELFIEQ